MKAFLVAFAVVVAFCVGGLGSGYYFQHEFHRITSLGWDEFNEHSVMCEDLYKEPCGIYGGFAPKAQINIQKL